MSRSGTYLGDKLAKGDYTCSMQVVFVDIVSYSRRRSHAQATVIRAFMRLLEEALSETAEHFLDYTQSHDVSIRRDIVLLPSGDGVVIGFPFEGVRDMHLIFVGKLLGIVDRANAALGCGRFREKGWCNCHEGFLLRCGVSEGMVIFYKDLNGNINIAGNTVNMAERVMELADAGQVFLSQEAHHRLTDIVGDMDSRFLEYRDLRIKHDLEIDVYQYIDDSLRGLDVSPRGGLGVVGSLEDVIDDVSSPRLHPEAGEDFDLPNLESSEGSVHAVGATSTTGVRLEDEVRGQMMSIPAGGCFIGNDQIGRVRIEVPRPLLMGRCLITQGVYCGGMGRNPSHFVGEELPVEGVSWLEAVTFCNRLSELSGLEPVYDIDGADARADFGRIGYRLPTEAEWEYACRGGLDEELYGPLDDIAWYNGNSGGRTHDVAGKLPNGLGLYDMLGNVWEWCNDWYQRRYYEDWQAHRFGPERGFERVLRGGSWRDLPDCVRASFRHRKSALTHERTQGFRVVLPE